MQVCQRLNLGEGSGFATDHSISVLGSEQHKTII
jgi:hypothetical protein